MTHMLKAVDLKGQCLEGSQLSPSIMHQSDFITIENNSVCDASELKLTATGLLLENS